MQQSGGFKRSKQTHLFATAGKNWLATSFVRDSMIDEKRRTNDVLAETVVSFSRKNFVTGRFEWSQHEEFFE